MLWQFPSFFQYLGSCLLIIWINYGCILLHKGELTALWSNWLGQLCYAKSSYMYVGGLLHISSIQQGLWMGPKRYVFSVVVSAVWNISLKPLRFSWPFKKALKMKFFPQALGQEFDQPIVNIGGLWFVPDTLYIFFNSIYRGREGERRRVIFV